MKNFKLLILTLIAVIGFTTANASAAPTADFQLDKKIRSELLTLPFYDVFDNLAFSRDGATVTLYGQVIRPTTRSSAEARVRKLEGVEQVVNRIEVLPLSSFDDEIRLRAYHTIFNTGSLYRYALGANPSVRIIVNRGRLTLEGVVGTEGDSRLAYIAARSVPGVFEVTNNLRLDNEETRRSS